MKINPVALMGAVRNTYKPSHPIVDVNGLKGGLARTAGDGFCQPDSCIVGLRCDPLCAVRITEASCKNKNLSVRTVFPRSQMFYVVR